MDRYSILEPSSASPAAKGHMPGDGDNRSATASISAGIAAAVAHLPHEPQPWPRFPGEDGGHSLAEIAHRDLDAALQLLAERAQYITEASGAAIALRRGEHHDMLCRASSGPNAPGLGALLSMDYGLSGESVRTRQALRCDDAERDPRVNHEACRNLGIASVVVMPIVSDQQVLGVFELLSGKPRAFGERDLSALRRLGEMVETAVKYAVAAHSVLAEPVSNVDEVLPLDPQTSASSVAAEPVLAEPLFIEPHAEALHPEPAHTPQPPQKEIPPLKTNPPEVKANQTEPETAESEERKVETKESEKTIVQNTLIGKTIAGNTLTENPITEKTTVDSSPRKSLFWSAAIQAQRNPARNEPAPPPITVPAGLRNLQKCQACGFPVSQGRAFCVECEEKQWRGQPLPQRPGAAAPAAHSEAKLARPSQDSPSVSQLKKISSPKTKQSADAPAIPAPKATVNSAPRNPIAAPAPSTTQATQSSASSHPLGTPDLSPDLKKKASPLDAVQDISTLDASPVFASSIESQSWFSANKYIIGTLLLVAVVIAVIAFLH